MLFNIFTNILLVSQLWCVGVQVYVKIISFMKQKSTQTMSNQEEFVVTTWGNLTELHVGGAAGRTLHMDPLSTLQTGVLCKAPILPRKALGPQEAILNTSPCSSISYNFLPARPDSKSLGENIWLVQHEVSDRVGGFSDVLFTPVELESTSGTTQGTKYYNIGSQPWLFNPGLIMWDQKPIAGALGWPLQAVWSHVQQAVCGKEAIGILGQTANTFL